MSLTKTIFRYLMAIFMVSAGTMHFVTPTGYAKFVPPSLPYPLELVYVSGLCEVILGLLLAVPKLSRWAAWGIFALLIAVFPANVYVYQHQELMPFPPIVHFLRLPLQGVFLLWAYWLTRPKIPAKPHLIQGSS